MTTPAAKKPGADGRLEKLAKLVLVAAELQQQMDALLKECSDIIGGGVGIAVKLKQVEAAWASCWSGRYHGDYVFNFARDRAHLKRLLRTFTPEELEGRMVRYLQDNEPALVQRRHPFGWFISSINNYAPHGEAPKDLELSAPVSDCKHTPRCKSDQEHTDRKMKDLRGKA